MLEEHTQNMDGRTERPWGWYENISFCAESKVKRIRVLPGRKISLQKHQHRSEHWVVAEGQAEVTLDGCVQILNRGQHIDIGIGQVHRLANPGPGFLDVIEVQFGSYLGEDDIIRFEDDYGRA